MVSSLTNCYKHGTKTTLIYTDIELQADFELFIVYFCFLLQSQSDKIKLQLRVEELQDKYEPKGKLNNAKTTFAHWS